MTKGKRKGATAKGAGKTTGENFGGSLSRNDHFYLQQAFGMVFDPGTGSRNQWRRVEELLMNILLQMVAFIDHILIQRQELLHAHR